MTEETQITIQEFNRRAEMISDSLDGLDGGVAVDVLGLVLANVVRSTTEKDQQAQVIDALALALKTFLERTDGLTNETEELTNE